MGLLQRIRDVATSAKASVLRMGERTLYRALALYYATLDVVDWRNKHKHSDPEVRPLRTPVNRLVEFYVAHIWPGDLPDALPIVLANDAGKGERIIGAIHQVWTWSNWNARKQFAIRVFAMAGDMILKVVSDIENDLPVRVRFQVINPETVTDLETDDRGIVKRIRIDVPKVEKRRDMPDRNYTYTEAWDEQGMRIWRHDRGLTCDLSQLGTPAEAKTLEEAGVDFLPFVWAPFRDVGEPRGMNCFWAAIPKIDEADTLATTLHRMVFRFKSVLWAVQSQGTDAAGRPLPPPKIACEELVDGQPVDAHGRPSVELGTEKMISVNGTLQCLVPNINLDDAKGIVDAQVAEVEKDLPELRFYDSLTSGQVATETLRLMLAPALARVLEVRGNAEGALKRANMIALTMAQNLGLSGFSASEIGTYEAGNFEHGFEAREVWPMSETEKATLEKLQAEADQGKVDLGIPLEVVLEQRGYAEDEIKRILAGREKELAQKRSVADAAMERALRQFDQGAVFPTN